MEVLWGYFDRRFCKEIEKEAEEMELKNML